MRGEDRLTLTGLDALTSAEKLERQWVVADHHVGMGVNGSVVPASSVASAVSRRTPPSMPR